MDDNVSKESHQKWPLGHVIAAVEVAWQKGTEAADVKLEQMSGTDSRRTRLYGLCGGAHIEVGLDRRASLGRQLQVASQHLSCFSISAAGGGKAYLHFVGMHNRQERDVDVAAHSAALGVLKENLRVVGCVTAYYC